MTRQKNISKRDKVIFFVSVGMVKWKKKKKCYETF